MGQSDSKLDVSMTLLLKLLFKTMLIILSFLNHQGQEIFHTEMAILWWLRFIPVGEKIASEQEWIQSKTEITKREAISH